MRLHSDFRAYYDNALAYGIDDKVYCERVIKKVKIKNAYETQLAVGDKYRLQQYGFDLKESFRKKKQINK